VGFLFFRVIEIFSFGLEIVFYLFCREPRAFLGICFFSRFASRSDCRVLPVFILFLFY
jgi:hypothetical protein